MKLLRRIYIALFCRLGLHWHTGFRRGDFHYRWFFHCAFCKKRFWSWVWDYAGRTRYSVDDEEEDT